MGNSAEVNLLAYTQVTDGALRAAVERVGGELFTNSSPDAGWAHLDLDTRLWRLPKEAIEAGHAFDEVKPLASWTIHDLRRSAATWMAQNGVPPHVLGAILNHSSGSTQGITSIYNRFRYTEERREALEGWGQHVAELS